eukprot:TRINITY_DN68847_c1_g2_i2.p1 TRINITY_DN68847_c1_g2~~TRINITY_DN68847_c1_g2_i2.p1  ORF type:complete len:411 (-),score=59.71 TRINITY_DN68847_c1_g2_i2:113-1345(-)
MNEIQIKELFDRLETVEKSLKAVKQENETLKNGANRLNCAVHKIVQNLQKKTKEFEHSMKSFVEEKVEVSMDEVYAVKDEIQNSIDGLLFEMKQDRKTRKIMMLGEWLPILEKLPQKREEHGKLLFQAVKEQVPQSLFAALIESCFYRALEWINPDLDLNLLAYCRRIFEKECYVEIMERLASPEAIVKADEQTLNEWLPRVDEVKNVEDLTCQSTLLFDAMNQNLPSYQYRAILAGLRSGTTCIDYISKSSTCTFSHLNSECDFSDEEKSVSWNKNKWNGAMVPIGVPSNGILEWSIRVDHKNDDNLCMGISNEYPCSNWTYTSDNFFCLFTDGDLTLGGGRRRTHWSYNEGSIVAFKLDMTKGKCFFTIDDEETKLLCEDLNKSKCWYPIVIMHGSKKVTLLSLKRIR